MWDAVLSNWTLNQGRIYGTITADSKSRFNDNEPIVTSTVQEISLEHGRHIATTKSGTRYLLA